MRQFPRASQAEIMRAAEKDEHYAAHVSDACHEAFRHTFGTRVAMVYENESRLAGSVLYHLLTTGSGLQTLGEEYCDIAQVGGASGQPLVPAKRILLIFFHTILPYLAQRLSVKATAREAFLSAESAEEAGRNADSIYPDWSNGSISQQAQELPVMESNRPADSSMSQGHEIVSISYTQKLQKLWRALLQRCPRVVSYVQDAALLAMRGNLMLFYFEGMYYQLSKRAAGVWYIHTGKLFHKKPRYHLLGMFLLIQLSIIGGDWFRRTALPALTSSMRESLTNRTLLPHGQRCALILDQDGKYIVSSKENRGLVNLESSTAVGLGASKCSLCLSPRHHPTATPCGHIFCWNCIMEWCNEKRECPLCRSNMTHSDLVCMYNADM